MSKNEFEISKLPYFLEADRKIINEASARWASAIERWSGTDVKNAPSKLMSDSFARFRPSGPNNCVILVGPNGGGKNTFIEKGLVPLGGHMIVRDTTRKKRSTEIDGRDYNFITKDEFARREGSYLFATNHCYDQAGVEDYDVGRGILKEAFDNSLDTNPFIIITGGPITLIKLVPRLKCYEDREVSLTTVYLIPPSFPTLLDRLARRAEGDKVAQGEITRRICDSTKMLEHLASGLLQVDFVILNDDIDTIPEKCKYLCDKAKLTS